MYVLEDLVLEKLLKIIGDEKSNLYLKSDPQISQLVSNRRLSPWVVH